MTKGQCAMLTAMVHPEGQRGGAKDRGSIASDLGLSGELVRQARTVLRCAPQLADDVLARKLSLVDAYETIKARSTNSGSQNKPEAGANEPARSLPTTKEPTPAPIETDICERCGERLAVKHALF